jgi:hypothetical protein
MADTNGMRNRWFVLSLAALCAGVLGAAEGSRAAEIDCAAPSALIEPAGYAEACPTPETEPRPAQAGGGVFAVTSFAFAHDIGPLTNNFVRHRLNDFDGQIVLGPNLRLIFGYDFDPHASRLYALDSVTNQLGTMNLTSGAFTSVGVATPLAGHTWSALTIHPRTGRAFATSGNTVTTALYTINLKTGGATLVDVETTTGIVVAASINCDGAMYVHDVSRDSIFRMNTKTAAVTFVGATGVNSNFAQGMDFDNTTGTLYAWTYQGAGANQYGTFNLTTGDLTPLATNDPEGEFEGATQTTCPPPNTRITKAPKKQTSSRRAEFRFTSSFPGSRFQCRLDRKPFRDCSSPYRPTVKPGRHTFRVRSIDPVGHQDKTPASFSWRVTR